MEEALNLNLLVVDDHQINRLLINKILLKWGISADFAENGLQAVEKIEARSDYNLVLMDVYMPVMSGIEAVKAIRAKTGTYFQQLPIVALTASVLDSQKREILEAGMNDFILKPFEAKGLYEVLSRFQRQ